MASLAARNIRSCYQHDHFPGFTRHKQPDVQIWCLDGLAVICMNNTLMVLKQKREVEDYSYTGNCIRSNEAAWFAYKACGNINILLCFLCLLCIPSFLLIFHQAANNKRDALHNLEKQKGIKLMTENVIMPIF